MFKIYETVEPEPEPEPLPLPLPDLLDVPSKLSRVLDDAAGERLVSG